MFAIYKKEMRSYFINAIGYVYIADVLGHLRLRLLLHHAADAEL